MTITADRPAAADRGTQLNLLELEITHSCQLACTHCLTESHPRAGHGTMTPADWTAVIDQAAAIGVRVIQFIGGEPTVSPHLPALLEHALSLGLRVEVFTNLYRISDRLWMLFERPGVQLGTSYYSDRAAEHDEVTTVVGSHARTRAGIAEALRRGIPVRAGIVGVLDAQRTAQARADLEAMGVTNIVVDHARPVGRAAASPGDPDPAELCGKCGQGRAAVLPDGTVALCVLGRSLTAGNVRETPLADILTGPVWATAMARVPRNGGRGCNPDNDGSDCSPAETPACSPAYG